MKVAVSQMLLIRFEYKILRYNDRWQYYNDRPLGVRFTAIALEVFMFEL